MTTVIIDHTSWYRLWKHIRKELGGIPAWDEIKIFLDCVECHPTEVGYEDAGLSVVFRTKEQAMLFRLVWA